MGSQLFTTTSSWGRQTFFPLIGAGCGKRARLSLALRVHIGLWAAKVAATLPWDFVECGVNAGFMSSSIMHALDWDRRGRTFYLLDTFFGIDERYVSDAERSDGILEKNRDLIEDGFSVLDVAAVKRNFAEWKNKKIIQGSI